jgi:hypothetical protein
VAPENAPNRRFRRFAARFIRSNQNRGHDKKGPNHYSIAREEVANYNQVQPHLSLDKYLNAEVAGGIVLFPGAQ